MMKRTILCSEPQKEYLFEKEAEYVSSGVTAVKDIQTISLSSLLYEDRQSTALQVLLLAKKLREKKDSFPLYGDMFCYPVFFEEILSFAKECLLYGITVDDLPDQNDDKRELKRIVSVAMGMDLDEKDISLESTLQKIKRMKNVYVLDGFETSYYAYTIRSHLKDLPHIHWTCDKKPVLALRHALNRTKEIEACVQDILCHNKSCNVILADPQALPLVEAVFARYELPFSCTISKRKARISEIFASLVQFALHPDTDHFFKCVDLNAFGVPCTPEIRSFLEETMVNMQYPEGILRRFNDCLFQGDGNVETHVIQNIENIEKQASYWFNSIQKQVDHLLHPEGYEKLSSPAALIACAYDLIQTSPLYQQSGEYSTARHIAEDLCTVLPHIETREDALLYADMLGKDTYTVSHLALNRVIVTDLKHPVPSQECTYVLGCSAACYPAIPVRSGIFDEDYVKDVLQYPSLEERTSAYEEQLKWVQSSASEQIYYSYPTNDYDGKSIEPSFDVTSLFDLETEDKPWTIDEGNWHTYKEHRLSDPSVRKALFLGKDDIVQGSVSSIETWFNCPYEYFLKYGMCMNQHTTMGLDAITIGNFQHSLFESLVRRHKKKYASYLDETFAKNARSYFDALAVLMPVHGIEVDMTYQRLMDNLKLKSVCFDDYEKDSIDFIPKAEELSFDHFRLSEHVTILGKIDRVDVDEAHHLFRIIDYKTSALDINENSIASGTSLQLLSYLIAVYESSEIQAQIGKCSPAAMLYYPLVTVRNTSSDIKGSVLRSESSRKQMMFKNNAIHGWCFIDAPELVDQDLKHIKSIKKQHLYEQSKDLLMEVYEAFYHSLVDQDTIEPHPAKTGMSKACTFCCFNTICRYHGDGYALERVSNIRTVKEKKKEKEDED